VHRTAAKESQEDELARQEGSVGGHEQSIVRAELLNN